LILAVFSYLTTEAKAYVPLNSQCTSVYNITHSVSAQHLNYSTVYDNPL